jgi:hypothetical protein
MSDSVRCLKLESEMIRECVWSQVHLPRSFVVAGVKGVPRRMDDVEGVAIEARGAAVVLKDVGIGLGSGLGLGLGNRDVERA